LGTSFALEQTKQSNTKVMKQLKKASIVELVIEKSNIPIVIGIIFIIANCSRGDSNNI
jgi:hypothetical protein